MDQQAIDILQIKYKALEPHFSERTKRLWAATESQAIGRGGNSLVSAATGLSRTTIYQGIKDLNNATCDSDHQQTRKKGGGRKSLLSKAPEIKSKIKELVEDTTCGDPESPLLWTCKSTRQLAEALTAQNIPIGRQKISELLSELGYSLQGNRKTKAGTSNPDRDKQFRFLNRRVKLFQKHHQPVISVDTKKKELIGEFSNQGKEWRAKGKPVATLDHDFGTNRVNPYGVYDQTQNTGWVSVGTDHDTSEFAVESIRRWWHKMGANCYPQAKSLLITADCGGSNGYRVKLWKVSLQQLANELGITISVSHFPPGTSKWNKIEHRMFCHISTNWRGKPLTSYEVVVNLIGGTTTREGLTIRAELDENEYTKGKKVSDQALMNVKIQKANFHGDWNYKIESKCSS